MSTSRPTTPAAISDTSSDPDSLSDLDSGWTDLSSNRSGGRHSPSTSDAGDSEDARSAIDRYESEPWEGLVPEEDIPHATNIGEDTLMVESHPAAHLLHPPLPQQPDADQALEGCVADALRSSFLSDNGDLETSTPHMSIRGSRAALRLAFPDPLSNSEINLLPSHSLSRTQSQPTEATSEFESDQGAHTQTSLATTSSKDTFPSNPSLSVPDDLPTEQENSEENYDLPSMEFVPSSDPYALSVVLLGHPPLPHLKSKIVSGLVDMVASVFDGHPQIPKGNGLMRIYEVPVFARHPETYNERPNVTPTCRILISDRTSGPAASLSTILDCPTVALVFIQPPLSSAPLPSLPLNTQYLPLLLPSVYTGFSSSLLDLSPSVLFDHSVPNVATPDQGSRQSYALQQCVEMNIASKRLDGAQDVADVDEFTALSERTLFTALKDLIFPSEDKSKETGDALSGTTEIQSGLSVFRKQIVFMSAFLVALLFGSTVFLGRLTPSVAPPPAPPTPDSSSQKTWPFLHPFVNRVPSVLPTPSAPSPASTELPPRSRALMPASLRSLAVSVFRPESTSDTSLSPSTVPRPRPDKEKWQSSATRAADDRPHVRSASIDPAVRPLTLDPSKSLSVLPPAHRSVSLVAKSKHKAVDTLLNAPNPFPSSLSSLSTRISNALSPLFDVVNTDLRELHEAVDILLHAILQLQDTASQGISDLVRVLSSQAGQGAQEFANKVYDAAQTVGEQASYRHSRAKYNARKVRDVGERYVIAARQTIEKGLERARGNAREVFNEGISLGRKAARSGRQIRGECKKLKRQAREHRRNVKREVWAKRTESKSRSTGGIFYDVLALVA